MHYFEGDEEDGEDDDETLGEGTGIGEGQGKDDVSDQIEDEDLEPIPLISIIQIGDIVSGPRAFVLPKHLS